MFYNIFGEINIKKFIHWGEAMENGGTILISSLKCSYTIYLDIQVITWISKQYSHFYAFYWFLICNY